jgi:hypothetical protein
MAQQELNLLKLAAPGAAQLGAGSAEVMGRDAGNAGCLGVGLDELPATPGPVLRPQRDTISFVP